MRVDHFISIAYLVHQRARLEVSGPKGHVAYDWSNGHTQQSGCQGTDPIDQNLIEPIDGGRVKRLQ